MKSPLSARVQGGAFEGELHPRCTSAFSYIGDAPCMHQFQSKECTSQSEPKRGHEQPIKEIVEEVLVALLTQIRKP